MACGWLIRGLALASALAGIAGGQTKSGAATPEQSPRGALLEMFSGGEEEFKRHLTLEVQDKLKELLKGPSAGNNPLETMAMAKAAGGKNLESFDAGPILFSYSDPKQHQRMEIRIDNDDLRGDQDEMQLSVHTLHQGLEQDLPAGLHLLLSWKLQKDVWRLNAVTVSATLAVGDPRIFDKSTWLPVMGPMASAQPSDATLGAPPPATPVTTNEPAKMPVARAVRLITLAEDVYAKKHSDTGYTCSISELVGVGRGLEDGRAYTFMDPEFTKGVYNGYRFSLRGCDAKPANSFQVSAEPVTGTGRAYCSDSTHDLRASDDGSASHCLTSGRIVQR